MFTLSIPIYNSEIQINNHLIMQHLTCALTCLVIDKARKRVLAEHETKNVTSILCQNKTKRNEIGHV